MTKFLLKNPTVRDHAILLDIYDSPLWIPLMLQGITTYFPVQAATMSEYESDIILKFPLSSMLDFRGQIISIVTTTRIQIMMHVNAVSSSLFESYFVVDTTDDNNFSTYFESFVQISLTIPSRRAAVNHDKLAKHLGIHLDFAKAMVKCTTQHGVHAKANPGLSSRFWTNDCMLQYRHLHHPIFADTKFSNKYLHWNNKCVQIFALDFGWV